MASIFVEIASLPGERESCEIEFTQSIPIKMEIRSQRFGMLSFTADNLFSALLEFRLWLERDGCRLLCNAARKDAYPSRMALEMGGGRKIYLLKHGMQAKREDLIDVFDAAPIDQVCTVAEQRASYEAWIRSLK